MALINFYKGLKENYSPDTHGNSIYSCTDTNECYILGVLYENISEQEIADKIGTNTYTDANYISKETNLTDAAMQLDEEIKATNDNIAILNAASVKSVKVGSNTSNEAFSNGVITIANATSTTDGALSKEDKVKLDNIENTYVPLTGDSFKNNNACWGGTTTDGTTYCLALIDESDRVKIGNTNLPLYLRGSSIQFDDNSGDYYTVYHSKNLDINKWNVPQYTGDYNLIAKSGLTYWNNAAGEVSNIPAGTTNNPYGIMATFGNFEDGHLGESNVWGFQLGYGAYNDGTLYYRDFLGLTVSEWDKVVTSKGLLTDGIILNTGRGVVYQNKNNTNNFTGFMWAKLDADTSNITDDDLIGCMGVLTDTDSTPAEGLSAPRMHLSYGTSGDPWNPSYGICFNADEIRFNNKELAFKEDTALITIEVGTNLEANADRAALYTRIKNGNHNIRFLNGDYYCYPFQSTESLKSITFYYMLYSDGGTETRSVTINNDGSTINATY